MVGSELNCKRRGKNEGRTVLPSICFLREFFSRALLSERLEQATLKIQRKRCLTVFNIWDNSSKTVGFGLLGQEDISNGSLNFAIDHFTVVCSVPWPLNRSEAGGDLVLLQTFLLIFMCKSWYSHANKPVNMIVYIWKTRRFVTKQGHRQPRFYWRITVKSSICTDVIQYRYVAVCLFDN